MLYDQRCTRSFVTEDLALSRMKHLHGTLGVLDVDGWNITS